MPRSVATAARRICGLAPSGRSDLVGDATSSAHIFSLRGMVAVATAGNNRGMIVTSLLAWAAIAVAISATARAEKAGCATCV